MPGRAAFPGKGLRVSIGSPEENDAFLAAACDFTTSRRLSIELGRRPMDRPTEAARALIDASEHATVATIEPDGQPQLSVVWVKTNGDEVVFSTVVGRRKHTNLLRDPRITLLVFAPDDPDRYVEVRGRALLEDDPDKTLINDLSLRYAGEPFEDAAENRRVIVRIVASKIVTRGL
jgi:PPOX class probable F420-dependent enzyme